MFRTGHMANTAAAAPFSFATRATSVSQLARVGGPPSARPATASAATSPRPGATASLIDAAVALIRFPANGLGIMLKERSAEIRRHDSAFLSLAILKKASKRFGAGPP